MPVPPPAPTPSTQLQQAQTALWAWYTATQTHGTPGLPWPSAIDDPMLTSPAQFSAPSAYPSMSNFALVLNAFQVANNNATGFTGYQDGVLDAPTFSLLMAQLAAPTQAVHPAAAVAPPHLVFRVAPAAPPPKPGPQPPWTGPTPSTLPPFPGPGWVVDTPTGASVASRAQYWNPKLWNFSTQTIAKPTAQEQFGGRWLTFQAVKQNGLMSTVVWRLATDPPSPS